MAYWIVNSTFEQAAITEAEKIKLGTSTPYHAILSDPPYGIAFMGKQWDDCGGPAAFQEQIKLWGKLMLPLLYSGAMVFMFGSPRTWHRLASGMEDAGFRVLDTLMWLYGSGFPKNSRLKPAWEPVLCFKAPGSSPGVGNYNIDAARVGTGTFGWSRDVRLDKPEGRYPSNLLLDEGAAGLLGDKSRFYYCTKPSRKEREAGCGALPTQVGGSNNKGYTKDVEAGINRNREVHNNHPTVKPIDLNRYLASLLLVPNGKLLVPFSGSGSEMIGALQAGWKEVVGIEMDADYCTIAEARLNYAAASSSSK
jgi:DNA modification methylase